MTAGMNMQVDLWRMTPMDDDSVGGAMISGSLVYHEISARMDMPEPEMLLLQQGLETRKLVTFLVRPPSMLIYERDEVEVVFPSHHQYFNRRFRVVGVEYTSLHPSDSRGFIKLHTTRVERAHARQ